MIAADALVIVRSLVLIEGIGCEIEHTIVEALVAEDELVGLCHLLRCVTLELIHKHLIIEITLVDHPHIHQAEHGDAGNHKFGTEFLHFVKQEEGTADDDNPEGTPAIGCEDALANLGQIADDRTLVFGRQLLQSLQLLY